MEVQSASTQNLDYQALATVLVDAAKSGDDAIRLTALRWLRSFVVDAKAELLPLYAIILQAILPALSSSTPEIQQVGLAMDSSAERVSQCMNLLSCHKAFLSLFAHTAANEYEHRTHQVVSSQEAGH